ncbi:tetratricopeptide repeat protein [Geitlerinema splendidum]|nr:tetratricopeptide repeat protein [Geitlerinema splendidum]
MFESIRELFQDKIDTDESSLYNSFLREELLRINDNEFLAYFLKIIEVLNANNILGAIFLDRIEAGSDFVWASSIALATKLPKKWGFLLAVNDEIPQGLNTIAQVWPPMAYSGVQQICLSKLDITAFEAWANDVKGKCPPLEELQQILKNCDGRPLFLRDWIIGVSIEKKSIVNRLGAYYENRIRTLSHEARNLLRLLSILPNRSFFSFEFCDALLNLKNYIKTYEILNELEEKFFLERSPENSDSYRFIHDLTQEYISKQLPSKVLMEGAKNILDTFDICDINNEDPVHLYTLLYLSYCAGKKEKIEKLAFLTAKKLNHSGAYNLARQTYELYLEVTKHSEKSEFLIEATIGVISELYNTGHYEDALQQLFQLKRNNIPSDFIAEITLMHGKILVRINQYQDAILKLKLAGNLYQNNGNLDGQIKANKEINTILRDVGRYKKAVSLALVLVRRADKDNLSLLIRASCYRGLARSLAFFPKRITQAINTAQQALDIAKAENSIPAIGNAHLAFGEVYRHSKRCDEAIEHYRLAIDIAEKTANRDSFLWSALGLADALVLLGKYEDSQRIINQVGEIVEKAALRYPLEHLHWKLSHFTLEYLRGMIDEKILKMSANEYSTLGINWPHKYISTVINSNSVIIPKSF